MSDVVELIKFLKDLKDSNIKKADYKKELASISNALNASSRNSIVNMAKSSICQFPMLCSSNISTESMVTLNKVLEHLYATYLGITLSNYADVIDLTDKNGKENKATALQKIHQNDNPNFGFDSIDDNLNQIYGLFQNNVVENAINNIKFSDEILCEANRKLCTLYDDNFNSLNMSTLNENQVFTQGDLNDYYSALKKAMDSNNDCEIRRLKEHINILSNIFKNDKRTNEEKYFDNLQMLEKYEAKAKELAASGKDIPDDMAQKILDYKNEISKYNSIYSRSLAATKLDIGRKANDIEPLIVTMEASYMSNGGMSKTELKFGVKCITHIIDYKELMYYIPTSLIKKRALFRFIQWTTGEIKAKDFLFDITGNKFEGKNAKKYSSIRWFRHLKARSLAAKRLALKKSDKTINPNTSLVLSMADVDAIKVLYKIDLLKDHSLGKKLMDLFFLVGFYIIDESTGSDPDIYVYNNANGSSGMWEKYSLKKYSSETINTFMQKFNNFSNTTL